MKNNSLAAQEYYDERAGILEHCAGLSRKAAERKALLECARKFCGNALSAGSILAASLSSDPVGAILDRCQGS